MKPYYEEAGITIFHGDCREILPQLGRFDLLLTDPPYVVNLGIHKGATTNSPGHGLTKTAYVGYEDTLENLEDVVIPAIQLSLELATRGIVFCAGMHIGLFPKPNVVGGMYFPSAVGRNAWGFASLATALLYGPGCRIDKGSKATVFRSTAASEPNGHPCPKPIAAIKHFVALGSEVGDSIIDPFMGSGTTLVAAKNLGRTATGIDIEETYCEIAANRLRQSVLNFETEVA